MIKKRNCLLKSSDKVELDGKTIKREKHVYILLNKPKGYITTTKDPKDRKIVTSIIKNVAHRHLLISCI